jgi:predicted dehydrogenase/threonine dehydrogenase-like Zn-dependent dehydrogenase
VHQVTTSVKDGTISVMDVPVPAVQRGHVLIENRRSLISAGTEKSTIDLASKSLLGKARERPDHVRRVLEKARTEGLLQTLRQVQAKLDEPMAMGYSSAGVVLAVGAGVQDLKPGDRVVSNGGHAEVVCVPRNLCARIPDGVEWDQAVFTVLGAIALQSVRLAHAELGSTVYVVGLGLVGQLVVGLLSAQGCRVLAVDLDPSKCDLALKMGAEAASTAMGPSAVAQRTGGLGADAVIIAAATKSVEPVTMAADAVRKRGRVVLVGVADLHLDRRPFYFKEAEFVVSCSYGPGRYDPDYEERGRDYPAAYVRWTEQRNLEAVLGLIASRRLDPSPLVSHRFAIDKALDAYALIEKGGEPYVGIVLEYSEGAAARERSVTLGSPAKAAEGSIGVGVLGAGNFARAVLVPAIERHPGLQPGVICSGRGLSAAHTAERHGFMVATADEQQVLDAPGVGAVFVITRHDEHARQAAAALHHGKHVFVEKPLALTFEELDAIEAALADPAAAGRVLMVGFNRRFAPATAAVKALFEDVAAPLGVTIRFNAGAIPKEHWTQDEAAGGGRIVGEACHAIDLATWLTGSEPIRVFCESVGAVSAGEITDDQAVITLRHANGSVSSIAYLAGGDKAFPKERVEVIGGGRVAVIDDFRSVTTCAGGKTRTQKWSGQDKGHAAGVDAFARAITAGGAWPISWSELRAVSLASILAVQSIREGGALDLW